MVRQEASGNTDGKLATGCGIGCLVVVVLLGIASYVVFRIVREKIQPMAAQAVTTMVEESLKDSGLGDAEKASIRKSVTRLTDKLENGELAADQFMKMWEALVRGPLIHLLMVKSLHEQHVATSGLPEDEKAAGKRATDRLLRGVSEQKIPLEELQKVIEAVPTETGPDGQERWKERLTDDEIRQVLAAAKRAADEADIPDEPYEVDIAAEVDKIIDAALSETDA